MMQDRDGKYDLNSKMQSLYDSWKAAQSEDVVDANSESSIRFRSAQDRKQALTKVKNAGVSKLFASAFDKLPQSMREQISSKQMSREDFNAEKASLDVFSSLADILRLVTGASGTASERAARGNEECHGGCASKRDIKLTGAFRRNFKKKCLDL